MDESTFDAITRSAGAEAGPRRAMVRFLAGAVLSAMTARLIPVAWEAEASSIRGKAKRTHSASDHPPHRHGDHPHAHHHAGTGVQSAGKRKGKGKKDKHPHKSPPLPPSCRTCNECQMCQDETCVPDPDLSGVVCRGSGAACGYCQDGQCVASDKHACGNGFCPSRLSQCCEGERLCPDRLSPSGTGTMCVPAGECCPDTEQRCGQRCASRDECCEELQPQNCGPCGPVCRRGLGWGCSTQKPCPNGTCVEQDQCCSPELKPCPDGSCINKSSCCNGERKCPDGKCTPNDQCCANVTLPVCGECQVVTCKSGRWECEYRSGCCPAGGVVCHNAPAQDWPWPPPTLHLPAGCCRAEKMFTDPTTGQLGCAQPWSGGSAWMCD
jgi:hypothetical protein